MPENSTKINIDGDAKSYIGEATRARKATKEIADEAAKAGSAIEDWAGKVGKAALGIAAVAKAVAGAAKAGNDMIEASGKASEAIGARALNRGRAAARLGVNPLLLDEWTKGSAQNAQQVDDFLGGLSEAKTANGGRVGTDAASRAIKLFATGLYDKSEIMDAVEGKRGSKSLDELESGRGERLAALGPAGIKELALRQKINATNEAAEYARQAPLEFGTLMPTRTITGDDARVAEARMAQADAENPGSALFRAGLAKIPIIGGALDESIRNERMLGNADIPYMGGESSLQGELKKQTAIMQQDADRPAIGPGADFQ